jgi:hypothetical protein
MFLAETQSSRKIAVQIRAAGSNFLCPPSAISGTRIRDSFAARTASLRPLFLLRVSARNR